jgi:hypothetical protein
VLKGWALNLHAVTKGQHAEDPRLWESEDGKLMLAWSLVNDDGHREVIQMISEVEISNDKPRVKWSRAWVPAGLPLSAVEKNWTPLPDGGMVYSFEEGVGVSASGQVISMKGVRHPMGTLSGGTPGVRMVNGNWLTIAHGYRAHESRFRRYYGVAVEVAAKTLEVVRMSRVPIFWGSDEDEFIRSPRAPGWLPCCVFPSGLVRWDDDSWLITLGVNDSWNAAMLFTESALDLVPVAEAMRMKRPVWNAEMAVPEGMALGRVVGMLSEGGFTYEPGDFLVTTPERMAGIGVSFLTPVTR